MTQARPTQLALGSDGRLVVEWSDGMRRAYGAQQLRSACPCATCREKRSQPPEPPPLLNVLSASEAQPIQLAAMSPVGNYAYSIRFNDGHESGIYTFELLRELGEELAQR